MDYDGVDLPDDLEIRVWYPESGYRTCPVCGGDCEPETGGTNEHGIRIMFVCSEHGVHSMIAPFGDRR